MATKYGHFSPDPPPGADDRAKKNNECYFHILGEASKIIKEMFPELSEQGVLAKQWALFTRLTDDSVEMEVTPQKGPPQ